MAAASLRPQVSAGKFANASPSSPDVDLASEIIQQPMARVTFAANAQAIRADSKMMASLLDITA